MYTNITECPTKDLREHVRKLGVSKINLNRMTRSECVTLLKRNGVLCIDLSKPTSRSRSIPSVAFTNPTYEDADTRGAIDVIVTDIQDTAMTRIDTFESGTDRFNDARYSNLTVSRNIHVQDKLFINNRDVQSEIQSILDLKTELSKDIINIQVQLNKLQNDFQIAQNRNLSIYNIASEIAYHFAPDSLQPSNLIELVASSFAGRLEDDIVDLETSFTVKLQPIVNRADNDFIIRFKLPFPATFTRIKYIPASIVIGLDYDPITNRIGAYTTNAVAFIDDTEPEVLKIRTPSFFTHSFPRIFKIHASIRYFGSFGGNLISPARFSELYSSTITTNDTTGTNTCNLQWNVLGKRVELFGNCHITHVSTASKQLDIDLPLSYDPSGGMEIVGICIINQNINAWLGNYSFCFISGNIPDKLSFYYSNQFLPENDYLLLFHIVYFRVMTNVIQNLTFDKLYVATGQVVNVTWTTNNNMNSYYFDNTFSLTTPWELQESDYGPVSGSQKNWYMPIRIPTDSPTGNIRVNMSFFGVEYQVQQDCIIDMMAPSQLAIVPVLNAQNPQNSIDVSISTLVDDTTIANEVHVFAKRMNGYGANSIVDASANIVDFTIDSPLTTITLSNLKDDVDYSIHVHTIDALFQEAQFQHASLVRTTSYSTPTLYHSAFQMSVVTTPEFYHESPHYSTSTSNILDVFFAYDGYMNSRYPVSNHLLVTNDEFVDTDSLHTFLTSNVTTYDDQVYTVGGDSSFYLNNYYDSFVFVPSENDVQPGDIVGNIHSFVTVSDVINEGNLDISNVSMTLSKITFSGNLMDVVWIKINDPIVFRTRASVHTLEYVQTMYDVVRTVDTSVTQPFINSQFPDQCIRLNDITYPLDSELLHVNIVDIRYAFTGNIPDIEFMTSNLANVTARAVLHVYSATSSAVSSIQHQILVNTIVKISNHNNLYYINNLWDFNVIVTTQFPHNQFNVNGTDIRTKLKLVSFDDIESEMEVYLLVLDDYNVSYTMAPYKSTMPRSGVFRFTASTLFQTKTITIVFDSHQTVDFTIETTSNSFDIIQANVVSFNPLGDIPYVLTATVFDISSLTLQNEISFASTQLMPYLSNQTFDTFVTYLIPNMKHSSKYMVQYEMKDLFDNVTTKPPVFVCTQILPDIQIDSIQQSGARIRIQASMQNKNFITGKVNWFVSVHHSTDVIEKSPIRYASYMDLDVSFDSFSSSQSPLWDASSVFVRVHFTFDTFDDEIHHDVIPVTFFGILHNELEAVSSYANLDTVLRFQFESLETVSVVEFQNQIANMYLIITDLIDFEETTISLSSTNYILDFVPPTIEPGHENCHHDHHVIDENTRFVVQVQPLSQFVLDPIPSGYIQLKMCTEINSNIVDSYSNVYQCLLDQTSVQSLTSRTTQMSNGVWFLNISDVADDTPIPKTYTITSLVDPSIFIEQRTIFTPYPVIDPKVTSVSSVDSDIVGTVFQFVWNDIFYSQTDLLFYPRMSSNSVYYRMVVVQLHDAIVFDPILPLYMGTIEEDTNHITLTYEPLTSNSVNFTSTGAILFHSDSQYTGNVLLVNVVDDKDFEDTSSPVVMSVDISAFDVNHDIFKIHVEDALHQPSTFYHPDVILGNMKTSSVSYYLNVYTNMIDFQFQVTSFVSIPTYGNYLLNFHVYGIFDNETTLLTSLAVEYQNGQSGPVSLRCEHTHAYYVIQCEIQKASSSKVHIIGDVHVPLNQLDSYDKHHRDQLSISTSNVTLSDETGLYVLAFFYIDMGKIGRTETGIMNFLIQLDDTTENLKVHRDAIRYVHVLGGGSFTSIQNAHLDLMISSDVDPRHMNIYSKTYVAFALLQFTQTSNATIQSTLYNLIVGSENMEYVSVNLDSEALQGQSLTGISFMSAFNMLSTTISNTNGTLMSLQTGINLFNTLKNTY